MRKALFIACLAGAAAGASAQSQIATLSHGGEISTFYGGDALKDAHQQAVSGDVITLSAGTFNAVDITKPITIRGAGMGIKLSENDSSYTAPTIIMGDFRISANSDSANHFVMEGIVNEKRVTFHGVNNAQFIRCNLHEVRYTSDDAGYGRANTTLFNCYVNESYAADVNVTTLSAISSYIKNFSSQNYDTSSYQFTNCIVDGDIDNADRSSFFNCILVNDNAVNPHLGDTSTAFNSLWVGPHDENPFKTTSSATEHFNSIFPNDSVFVPNTFFKLTGEAKKYLGADGTEVGIYGGILPFDPTPTIPQITKFNVAPKTSADGKLSVDITVEQPE